MELHRSGNDHRLAGSRQRLDLERIVRRIEVAGYPRRESELIGLAVLMTIASPSGDLGADGISALADRIGDPEILLETAGVVFAFNTINRIADARRVRLEYRFFRELKPIRGWVERRLVSLASLAYDLSFKHHSRRTAEQLQNHLNVLFERLGTSSVPGVFRWLSQSPAVLEGVLEMIAANAMSAGVHAGLLKEAVAIGVASRSMPGSDLQRTFEHWLPLESLADSKALREWAAPPGAACDSDLLTACRRYSWQVANAAYTITDEQVARLSALGLSDAERLDLTLATAVFSALAIIEPIGAAVASELVDAKRLPSRRTGEVEVQLV